MFSIKKLEWNELLEQATEDITTYSWAVDELISPEEDYSKGYLITLLFSSRARGRYVLSLMKDNVPEEDKKYRDKLVSIFDSSDLLLNREVLSQENNVLYPIVNDEIIQTIKGLLDNLKNIGEDLKNENTVSDSDSFDLKDAAHSFFLNFRNLSFMNDELLKELGRPEKLTEFYEAFRTLEYFFENSYDYFSILKDIYPQIRRREYFIDRWWLDEPEAEYQTTDNLIDILLQPLLQDIESDTERCPEAQQVIAFARKELSFQESADIEKHIIACPHCLELALDVQLADKKAPISALKEVCFFIKKNWLSIPLSTQLSPSFSGGALGALTLSKPIEETKSAEAKEDKPIVLDIEVNEIELSVADGLKVQRSRRKRGSGRKEFVILKDVPGHFQMEQLIKKLEDANYFWWGWFIDAEKGFQELNDDISVENTVPPKILSQNEFTEIKEMNIFIAGNRDILERLRSGESLSEQDYSNIERITYQAEEK